MNVDLGLDGDSAELGKRRIFNLDFYLWVLLASLRPVTI